MDLVLDLGLKVQIFQKSRDLVLNIRWLALALDYFLLDSLLDRPKSVTIFDILENQLSLLTIAEIHIGFAALWLG